MAPKEQPPRKLSGKRTARILSTLESEGFAFRRRGKPIINGSNLSGTNDRGGTDGTGLRTERALSGELK